MKKNRFKQFPIDPRIAFFALLTCAALFLLVAPIIDNLRAVKVFTFSEFLHNIDNKQIKTVDINGQEASGELVSGEPFKTILPEGYQKDIEHLSSRNSDLKITIIPANQSNWWQWLILVLGFVIIPVGIWFFYRKMMNPKDSGGGGPAAEYPSSAKMAGRRTPISCSPGIFSTNSSPGKRPISTAAAASSCRSPNCGSSRRRPRLMTGLPKAIVLFGAGGFIGRNIVDALTGKVESLIGVTATGQAVRGCDVTVGADRLDDIPALPDDSILINVAAARYDPRRFRDDQSLILARNLSILTTAYRFCVARGISEVRQASSSAVYPAGAPSLDDEQPLDLNAPPMRASLVMRGRGGWPKSPPTSTISSTASIARASD